MISVIIVAYKSVSEIGACLASIPAFILGEPSEVILVNNSPEDGLGDTVAHQFPSVRYIEPPENLGFGRGNNLGYRNSHGTTILFLNPDTVCNLAALELCLGRIKDDPTIGLISPKLVLPNGSMDLACRRSIPSLWDGFCRAAGLDRRFPRAARFNQYNLAHLPPDETYDVGAINGAFMMARREVLERVGLFDEQFFMYGDDLDLCIRVGRAGYRIVYDGRVKITHIKGVSVARDFHRMSEAIFDANRDVYLKHFNPKNSRLVRMKYCLAFGLWKRIALFRARLSGYQKVKPL